MAELLLLIVSVVSRHAAEPVVRVKQKESEVIFKSILSSDKIRVPNFEKMTRLCEMYRIVPLSNILEHLDMFLMS